MRLPDDIISILLEVTAGVRAALDDLFPLVYERLRAVAHSGWPRSIPITLNTKVLTDKEVAEALTITSRTVHRDRAKARGLLLVWLVLDEQGAAPC